MFSVHCPDHGAEVLLSERRISAIVALPDAYVVRWRCWCGATGSTRITRRAAQATAVGDPSTGSPSAPLEEGEGAVPPVGVGPSRVEATLA
jgi:hypothetical protein